MFARGVSTDRAGLSTVSGVICPVNPALARSSRRNAIRAAKSGRLIHSAALTPAVWYFMRFPLATR